MAKLADTGPKTHLDNNIPGSDSASLSGYDGMPDSLALDDPFFPVVSAYEIDQSLWCQSRPYQLAILRSTGKNYELLSTYTMPLGPESYSVSTPFAITTSATLGGIVEQHNGAPFRNIIMGGSTGVAPFRGRGEPFGGSAALLSGFGSVGASVGSIFAGTVQNIQNVVNSTKAVWTGNGYVHPNVSRVDVSKGDDLYWQTGYFQFLLLRGFLETYVTRKKSESALRLALIVWKEELAYLVTPVSFDLQRQAQAPLEYRYQMQFRAWKRIPLTGVHSKSATKNLFKKGTSLFKDVLNRLNSARATVQGVKKAILSIQSDFDGSIGLGLRETILGLKDIAGTAKTVYDFPRKFSQYLDTEIANTFDSLDFSGVYDPRLRRQVDQMAIAAAQHRDRAGRDQNPNVSNSLSAQDIAQGRTQNTQPTSPVKRLSQILNSPDNEALLDLIPIDQLPLSNEARQYKATAELKASTKSRLDYLNLKSQMEIFIATYSDKIGLGSATYSAMVGAPTVPQIREATQDDLEALHAFEDVLTQYARLASIETEDQDIMNSMEYVATLAGASEIPFRVPRSKFAVPFPFGSSLERLAYMYLGDPDRWNEIATLNGLREPYVDEVGFDVSLQYSADGNVVQVPSVENLAVGQSVAIYSPTLRETRKIKAIVQLPDGYAVTLDGLADLGRFGPGTKLHAYLPDTANSGQLIYIPSDSPLDEALLARSVPGQDSIDAITRVGGWDLMLTTKNDLAVTSDGDVKLATGMANIIQRIRTIFTTPVGSWLHHPEFGFAVQPGMSNSDVSAKQVLDSANGSLTEDPNLSVTSASVELVGPVTRLNVEVAVRGATALLPVSIDVR